MTPSWPDQMLGGHRIIETTWIEGVRIREQMFIALGDRDNSHQQLSHMYMK